MIVSAAPAVLVSDTPASTTSFSGTSRTNNTTTTHHSSSSSSRQPDWLESASFDHKLWVVRERLKLESNHEREDDFLAQVQQCREYRQGFQRQQQQLKNKSHTIQSSLKNKISDEESKCQEESANISAMEQVLHEIAQERDSLQNDLKDLEAVRQDLEQRIASAIEEASQEVEKIDMVEESRKERVHRLKHQISLYASTSGIKWDFENEQLLEGHVVSTGLLINCCIFVL